MIKKVKHGIMGLSASLTEKTDYPPLTIFIIQRKSAWDEG